MGTKMALAFDNISMVKTETNTEEECKQPTPSEMLKY